MKTLKKILCVIIIICFIPIFSASAEETSGTSLFEEILDAYLDTHLDGRSESEVLKATLLKLIEDHPELLNEIIDALIGSGDKYSFYMSPEEYLKFQNQTTYGGIGIQLRPDADKPLIDVVTPSGPAQIAGIKVGDQIVEIDGFDVSASTVIVCSGLLRGETGAPVRLKIKRGDEILSFSLVRKNLPSQVVSFHYIDSDILYIKISSFLGSDFLPQFVKAIDEYYRGSATRYIIDLRDNAGGSVLNMLDMVNYLITEPGLSLISMFDKDGNDLSYYTTGRGLPVDKIVMLTNKNTVSASESAAFIMQGHDLATIVGETTYGKGVAQTLKKFSDGSAAYIVAYIFKDGKGETYDGVGVIPDVPVSNNIIDVPFPKMDAFNHENYTTAIHALSQRLVYLGYIRDYTDTWNLEITAALAAIQKTSELPMTGELDLYTFQHITDIINIKKVQNHYDDLQLETAIAEVRKP